MISLEEDSRRQISRCIVAIYRGSNDHRVNTMYTQAFNSIDRVILIRKPTTMIFVGNIVVWIASYLSNRHLLVKSSNLTI